MLDQEFQEHDLLLAILDKDEAYYKKSLSTQCKKLRITPDKLLAKLFFKYESVEILPLLPLEIGRAWCRSELGRIFELDFDCGKIEYLSEFGADDDRAIASFVLGDFFKENPPKGVISKVIGAWINRDFVGIIDSLEPLGRLIENGKVKRSRFNYLTVLLHILSLIKEEKFPLARKYLTIYQNFLGLNTMIRALDICLDFKAVNVRRTKKKLKDLVYGLRGDKSEIFFRNLAYFWINDDFSPRELQQLKDLREQAETSHNRFMFYEIDALVKRHLKAESLVQEGQNFSNIRLCEMFDSEASWEDLLTTLSKTENPLKLIWLVRLDTGSELQEAWCEVEPATVEHKSKNKYGSPKIIGWQELLDRSSIIMSEQDKQVLSLLKRSNENDKIDYKFPDSRALSILHKAENIYLLDEPSQKIYLEERRPEIDIETCESRYDLSWSFPLTRGRLHLHEIEDFKYEVCCLTESQTLLREKLLKTLSLPRKTDDLKKFTESLASNVVLKGSEGLFDLDETPQSTKTKIKCRFNPSGVEYKLEIVAQSDWGYEEVPGKGRVFISIKSQGRIFQWLRDLPLERTIVEKVLRQIDLEKNSDLTYEIYDRQHLLEILEKLNQIKDITIDWPKDLKVSAHKYSSGILSVNASENKDWFHVEGKLNFGEVVVKLATLIEKLDKKSRYVTLSENQYLIITEELKEQLIGVSELVDQRDEQLLLHSTLAEQFNSSLNGVPIDLEEDILFKDAVRRALHAKKEIVVIPKDLKVELRPYQETGYKWLARMTSQGIGVCLADDMGLGKTIQTLALLSLRSTEGPSIVVAPTSLCINWCNEAERFTRGLNFINYSGDDRRDYLKKLGPADIIVVSYSILINDGDFLSEIVWNVMVLDEAQMVKNTGTLRSKSIRLIQSKYRVALSGTPLENHTGELWNIFDILNPGLLGNRSAFNKNFALPIERGDQQALKKLRSRIKTFLLRRLRKHVLDDLPESQESVFYINLSEKENDLYNAHRYNAIKNLKKFRKESKTRNKKRIEILAEITRLRIAAANPQIVDTQLDISNKSDAVINKLRNLDENGHATLIFSQFVNHLDIIQNLLIKEGITFSRLDGSMNTKTRQQSIESFSNGLVSCMLISLKAGGVGLNLTRADHVIHLDPWWNPAVEDQAIARAVRMGQKNKVNVIRFISKNTIEDDIIKLHDSKRGLADDLLKGTGSASKLSVEELIGLIENN